MSSICIIPARGGSKRIPRKNIKNFLGKPIIAYSIELAINSGLFSEVIVSTDDYEIANVGRDFGAVVPFFRSRKNSDDFATTVEVLIEVLQVYKEQGKEFKTACCIYPTAPLTRMERLVEGRKQLLEGGFDSVFPIAQFSYPIGRSLQINDGKVSMIWPENLDKRSQDLPSAYHDAGQWYWFQCEQLVRSAKLWTNNAHGIIVSELEFQDIDNISDWRMAELKYELLQKP